MNNLLKIILTLVLLSTLIDGVNNIFSVTTLSSEISEYSSQGIDCDIALMHANCQ